MILEKNEVGPNLVPNTNEFIHCSLKLLVPKTIWKKFCRYYLNMKKERTSLNLVEVFV